MEQVKNITQSIEKKKTEMWKWNDEKRNTLDGYAS